MNQSNIFRNVLITGLCAALFIPFIIADTQLYPFITGKGFTFRILVEILLGVWIVGMLWDVTLRPKFSWLMGSVLAFMAIITVADLAGISFYKSFWSNFERMDGLVTLLHLLVYFVIAGAALNTTFRWKIFLNISVIASVIMSFYAFLQLAGNIPINQGGVRVDGTFGNATYLAVYMLFNIFLTIYLWLRNYQENNKINWPLSIWYIVALVFQLYVLYSTATRGAILGLIGGLIIFAVIVSIFEKNRPVLRKTAIWVLVAIIVLVGGFFALRNTSFVQNSQTLSRFASLSFNEVQKQGRRYVWPMAIEGFKEKPILGWGQENFNYVFNENYNPRMYNQEPWFDRAHNIVLDWLIAGGLLGLLGYLSILVSLIWLIWRSSAFSLTDKALLIGLSAAYFFQNLFVFDNLISYIYFFTVLAFVHSENVRNKTLSPALSKTALTGVSGAMVAVSAVLVIGLIYTLNVRPIQANRTLIKAIDPQQSKTAAESLENFKKVFEKNTFANGEAAEQMFLNINRFQNPTEKPEALNAFAVYAIERLNAQIEKYPNDARGLLFMGSMLNRLGQNEQALPYLERALKASPNKQTTLFEIGFAHLSGKPEQYPKALEAFKTAYDLAPEFSEARLLYGIGALYNKNPKLAQELFASLSEQAYLSDERIISALHDTGNTTEAIKILERRVALDSTNPDLRFRVAAGYLNIGQRAKAVEALRIIVKDFPEYKDRAEYYIREIQAGRNP